MLTMKAYKKFGLFQDPFTGDVAKADDVYLTDETRFVAEFLYQTAKAGGMVALLGESGSGKTTIRRYAMDRIQSEGQKIKIITPRSIDKARLTTSAICGYFLHKNHAFVASRAACIANHKFANEFRSQPTVTYRNSQQCSGTGCGIYFLEIARCRKHRFPSRAIRSR